jgi:hypothetical protein
MQAKIYVVGASCSLFPKQAFRLTLQIYKNGMLPFLSLLYEGASHFCRNNFLWGGHPARPLALTGKMPVPQENVFAQLGYSRCMTSHL